MAQVYISLGSNINKKVNLANGLNALHQVYGTLRLSSLYECQAVGFVGDSFFNMVIGIDTQQSLNEVAEQLRAIEIRFGRPVDAKKFSSRTLDLDILLFDNIVLVEPIQIPRHEILTNAFVLWPLAEIAGNLKHPQKQQSFNELWDEFDKNLQQIEKVPFQWNPSTGNVKL
ncbi:2-amino-4-hydroxy-6-hydroxymethyldihydropteridine diphosphokinase [Thalassotalea profundi]|uniref:2-amino-4-hydroxy-6-hydroxymethyldihydropteridine diphosphokinase n=1 Tax=Thalassotalea profundi TaxID=2036687 RepID=A0ABQ3IFL1_9GAMM|nr:2-amino-4-hydroxy-6-hydroxymethyldihydropteridine diphosphokinase [Thalassotalea profundi]GHE81773.1 2-amino-4-hydroxy-6-hydroxymethyldihydropteridine diphosphokinase [Thalassotalea profundi]